MADAQPSIPFPSIGRIVHVRTNEESKPLAALVVDVSDDDRYLVRLVAFRSAPDIFNPNAAVFVDGFIPHKDFIHETDLPAYYWVWPPRV